MGYAQTRLSFIDSRIAKNIEEIQEALKLKRAKRAEIAKESGGKAELEEILKEGLKVTIKDKDGKEITSIY